MFTSKTITGAQKQFIVLYTVLCINCCLFTTTLILKACVQLLSRSTHNPSAFNFPPQRSRDTETYTHARTVNRHRTLECGHWVKCNLRDTFDTHWNQYALAFTIGLKAIVFVHICIFTWANWKVVLSTINLAYSKVWQIVIYPYLYRKWENKVVEMSWNLQIRLQNIRTFQNKIKKRLFLISRLQD